MCMFYSRYETFILQVMNIPSKDKDTYQEHMYTLVPQVKTALFMDDKILILIPMDPISQIAMRSPVDVKNISIDYLSTFTSFPICNIWVIVGTLDNTIIVTT